MDTNVPRARRLLDPNFRWRGSDVSRMEAFADAVFALVLALLFLRAQPPVDMAELSAALKNLVPFAATFAVLGMVWVDHHRYFRRYGLQDGVTFFGNLLLLFLVLFYAYPLKFLATLLSVMLLGPIGEQSARSMTAGFDQLGPGTLMLFYSGGFGAIYVTLALLYRHALRRGDDLQLDAVERHATVTSLLTCLVMVLFAGLSVLLTLLSLIGVGDGSWGGWVYFGIGPVMAVLGFRRGAAEHRLVQARGAGGPGVS